MLILFVTVSIANEIQNTKVDNLLKLGKFKEVGYVYGSNVFPKLLKNTMFEKNMNSETMHKGCDFIVSFLSQDSNYNLALWKKEISDSCVFGYLHHMDKNGVFVVDGDTIRFEKQNEQ